MKRIVLIAMVILLSSSIALPQDFCKGDFTYDGDVDADDVTTFLEHFGRGQYYNPCPPDGVTPVPQTGQTTSYATGDDGDLERGVALVTPRFTDNGDGTVTDNQTGLIWTKNAFCFGGRTWNQALIECNQLESGECELTDYSSMGDWRLPNIRELQSLLDYEEESPSLPSGHPFINESSSWYWSSTSYAVTELAFRMRFYGAQVGEGSLKTVSHYVWCVRGGH